MLWSNPFRQRGLELRSRTSRVSALITEVLRKGVQQDHTFSTSSLFPLFFLLVPEYEILGSFFFFYLDKKNWGEGEKSVLAENYFLKGACSTAKKT